MTKSKTAIIREYLSSNPDATGKDAELALKKYGINAQYFSQIKSNLSNRKKVAKKKAAKKKSVKTRVKRKVRRSTTPPSLEELQSVAEFANAFGGLDKLSSTVETLRRFQMNSN